VFSFDIKNSGRIVFPKRPQLAGVFLWSGEGNALNPKEISWEKGAPNMIFINNSSPYKELALQIATQHHIPFELIN
jgi:hypothetical protein